VKLSSVNFDGVLSNMKMPNDFQQQMMGGNVRQGAGQGYQDMRSGQGDMQNLIHVSSF
jgi:hypothetical protein